MDTKDRPGACVICHRDMIIETVSDGKVIKIFAPYKTEVNFELHDGSRMPVCMCTMCRDSIDLTNSKVHNSIMTSVVEGWKYQVDQLVADEKRQDWIQEKADIYMEKHKDYKIVRRIGDVQ